MKIIFMLRIGVIEWPIPPDIVPPFHFPSCATTVRTNGFFMSDTLYIKHDDIIGMSFAPDDAAPAPVMTPQDAPPRRDLN